MAFAMVSFASILRVDVVVAALGGAGCVIWYGGSYGRGGGGSVVDWYSGVDYSAVGVGRNAGVGSAASDIVAGGTLRCGPVDSPGGEPLLPCAAGEMLPRSVPAAASCAAVPRGPERE